MLEPGGRDRLRGRSIDHERELHLEAETPEAIARFLSVQLPVLPRRDESGLAYAHTLQRALEQRFSQHSVYQYLEALQRFAKTFPEKTTELKPYASALLAGSAAGQAAAHELLHLDTVQEAGSYSPRNIVRLNLLLALHPNEVIALPTQAAVDRTLIQTLQANLYNASGQLLPDALQLLGPVALTRATEDPAEQQAIEKVRHSLVNSIERIGLEHSWKMFQPKAAVVFNALFEQCLARPKFLEKMRNSMAKDFVAAKKIDPLLIATYLDHMDTIIDALPQWQTQLIDVVTAALESAGMEGVPSGRSSVDRAPEQLRELQTLHPESVSVDAIPRSDLFSPEKWLLFKSAGVSKSYQSTELWLLSSRPYHYTKAERAFVTLKEDKRPHFLEHLRQQVQILTPQIVKMIQQLPLDKPYLFFDYENAWQKNKESFVYYGGDKNIIAAAFAEKRQAIALDEERQETEVQQLRSEAERIEQQMRQLQRRYARGLKLETTDAAEMRAESQETGHFATIQLGLGTQLRLEHRLRLGPEALSDHITIDLGEDDSPEMIRFRGQTLSWLFPHEFSHEMMNQLRNSEAVENKVQQLLAAWDTIAEEDELKNVVEHYLHEAMVDGLGIQLVSRFGAVETEHATEPERLAEMAAALVRFTQVYVNYFRQNIQSDTFDAAVGHERLYSALQELSNHVTDTTMRNQLEHSRVMLEELRQTSILTMAQRTALGQGFAQIQQFGRTMPIALRR